MAKIRKEIEKKKWQVKVYLSLFEVYSLFKTLTHSALLNFQDTEAFSDPAIYFSDNESMLPL